MNEQTQDATINEPAATAKTNEQASSLSSILSNLTNTKLNMIDAASSLTQIRLAAKPVVTTAPTAPAPKTPLQAQAVELSARPAPQAQATQAQMMSVPSSVSSALARLRAAKTRAGATTAAATTSSGTSTTATTTATTAATATTRYQALSQTLTQTKAAIKNVPQVSSETFVIQGLFVNETGQPRPDCSLVATDAGDVLSSKLHPQRANADGYATLVLRAQEFPTVVNGTVPIFVSVIDSTGSQVYAPTTPITAKSGTVAVFRAVIAGTPT
jgi:hypothetical protein